MFSYDPGNLATLVVLALDRSKRDVLIKLLQTYPYLRDMVLGMGSALDPMPKCYRQTFITDDHLALLGDWIAIGQDFQIAMGKADHVVGRASATATSRKVA